MKPHVLAPLALALGLALATSAHGDQVRLRSGTTYDGKIVSADEAQVVIDTTDLGSLAIRLSEIESIERDGRTLLVGRDGKITEPGEETDEAGTEEQPDGATEKEGAEGTAEPVSAETGGATVTDPESTAQGGETAETAPPAEPELPQSAVDLLQRQRERLEQRSRGRLRRRRIDTGTTTSVEAETTRTTTDIGGRELARVAKDKTVIVFKPLTRFREGLSGIELGERTYAQMHAAGVSSAWLKIPFDAGAERYSIRLDEVKRHVMAELPSARSRMLEGIRTGDWLRVRLDDGQTVSGALMGYAGGSLKLSRTDGTPKSDEVSVSILDVVQLDGLQRNSGAVQALGELDEDEAVSVTYWPDAEEVLGRVVKRQADGVWIDTDGDRARDHFVSTTAPLANVLRVPPHWRSSVNGLRVGSLVRVAVREEFPDVVVERTHRSRVLGLTAHAVSVETDEGAVVVPFEHMHELDELEREEANEVIQGKLVKDESTHHSDVPLLPGMNAERAKGLDRSEGISALTDGREITHVFVTPPFQGEIYGFTLGTSTRAALKATDLRFHTIVRPQGEDAASRPTEYLSDTLRGMRITLLVSPAGVIEAVEIGRRR